MQGCMLPSTYSGQEQIGLETKITIISSSVICRHEYEEEP